MTDIENLNELKTYLRMTGRLEPNEVFEVQILVGGVSNRTVLLKRKHRQNWVLKQALEKLRVKVDWFSNPKRIHREAAGMRYLYQFAPEGSITRLVFEDEAEHILAMEAVADPHENWKIMLLRKELKVDHVEQFAQLLASIHKEAFLKADEVKKVFADRSYFENLRLEPYYLYTAEHMPEAANFLRQLVDDTRQRLFTLVHGDYSPKNVLVHQDRLILLDHEVIHFGDPAFDIGFAMTHLLSKAHHLTEARAAFQEAALQFWHSYAAYMQPLAFFKNLETYAIRHTLACLLARVKGRSPLEYLTAFEQDRQKDLVIKLIHKEPQTIQELIRLFVKGVERVDN